MLYPRLKMPKKVLKQALDVMENSQKFRNTKKCLSCSESASEIRIYRARTNGSAQFRSSAFSLVNAILFGYNVQNSDIALYSGYYVKISCSVEKISGFDKTLTKPNIKPTMNFLNSLRRHSDNSYQAITYIN